MKNTKPTNTQSSNGDPIGDLLLIPIEMVTNFVMWLLESFFDWLFQKLTNKKDTKNEEKITSEHINNRKSSEGVDTLGMSTMNNKAILLKEIDFNRHSIAYGASGYGKTYLLNLIGEYNLSCGRAIINFDPKTEIDEIESMKTLCSFYKRPLIIVSDFYPSQFSINPLKGLNVMEAVALIMETLEFEKVFYEYESSSALIDSISALNKTNQKISFKSIYDHLDNNVPDRKKENIQGLLSQLKSIVYSKYGRCLLDNGSAYSIEDIREKGACLYVGIATRSIGRVSNTVGKIFVRRLMQHSHILGQKNYGSKFENDNPMTVFFDELGSMVVNGLEDLWTKSRSTGLQMFGYVQTKSSIDKNDRSGFLSGVINENSQNIFIFKQSLDTSTEYFAKIASVIKIKKKTVVEVEGVEQGQGSSREGHEYIIHPKEFSKLRTGQCVLIQHDPKRVDLINVRDFKNTSPALRDRKLKKVEMKKIPTQIVVKAKEHPFNVED